MYSIIAMLFAVAVLGKAWIRIRDLEFNVEFYKSDRVTVMDWYEKLQVEFERRKKASLESYNRLAKASLENYNRLTAEIAELKQSLAALKKKNSTLKGQLTKEKKRASSFNAL